jgi:hypothetical protein
MASISRHPLELADTRLRISQSAGCDNSGFVQRDDLGRLVVEAIHLERWVDALLVAEDADPQVPRRVHLRGVARLADGHRQPAVWAQVPDFLVSWEKASMNSIGSGKTIVVFWLTPISSSVCR